MNTKKTAFFIILTGLFLFMSLDAAAKTYTLRSPDKEIEVKVQVGKETRYSLYHKGACLIEPSPLSMTLEGHPVLGKNSRVTRVSRKTIREKLYPPVPEKSREIENHYNQLTLRFAGGYSLVFRVFDQGAAYRFETAIKENVRVKSEEVVFHFSGDYQAYFPEEERFFSHNERLYLEKKLSEIPADKMCSLPVLVAADRGIKMVITESDLRDYPGLWLCGSGGRALVGKNPGVVLKEKQPRDRDMVPVEYAGYIADTRGRRTFPWRIVALSEQDGELLTNQLVYLLGPPLQLKDTSWIKPGKVAWDWYNYNNVFGVDFAAGVNTETYKYYIDFASKNGIEYVILDEGWYKLGDLLTLSPDIRMEELLVHAREKNVGIILWVVWKTLEDQFDAAFDLFEKWGVKGIKVDFMQRDDQWMVDYYWRVAKEAAERKMLVDFHGSYKPSGLRRAYPNVLTREGVKGLENNKWSDLITPKHNVTLPFIRMLAGPMDYTPGAMRNAVKENFRAVFKRPMSMGTRCHQLAMYVVFESPLQMLADSPTHYLEEPECLGFLSRVPTVWDRTVVLSAQLAGHVLVARKKGDEWYVGAMGDDSTRELIVDFSFLDAGEYMIDCYRDGVNAHRCAEDYKKVTGTVTRNEKKMINLAPGGGWAARIYKKARK